MKFPKFHFLPKDGSTFAGRKPFFTFEPLTTSVGFLECAPPRPSLSGGLWWSGDGRRWTWTQTHTRRQQITSLLLSCYCPSGPSHAAQQETQKVQRMHVQSPSKRLLLGSVYSPLPGSGITQPRINLFERTRSEIRGSLGARSNLKGMKITDLPSRSWASFLQLPLHCMKSLEEMAEVAVTGQEKGR